MTMKVDNSNNPLFLAPGWDGKARSPIEKQGCNIPPAVAGGTSVNIGATSAQLHGMENSTESTSVNTLKLAEIKQAISEGRFQVNSSAVADSLVRSVIGLISSQQA